MKFFRRRRAKEAELKLREPTRPALDQDLEPKRHVFRRIVLGVILVVVAALAFVIYNLSRISLNPLGFGPLKGQAEGRINLLVLGIGDPGHAGQNLSDTMML